MMLKEIKPGMAIHCKTEDEYKRLDEEVRKLGFGQLPNLGFNEESFNSDYVYVITDDCVFWNIAACREYTEFSDLIIPELTAEEVLSTISEMCENTSCNECYLGKCCDHTNSACSILSMEPNVIIDACIKWKSDHEKKEPEIETVDVCRIIEILPDGSRKCVHEEDIRPEVGGTLFSEENENILKRYCMEHDGNFIAVHEVVSRVKAVE